MVDPQLFAAPMSNDLYMPPNHSTPAKGGGVVPGVIACALAVLGIVTIGFVFVPLAALLACIGTVIAIKDQSGAGIGVNALAWVLTLLGVMTSPSLLILLGVAALS